MRILNLTPDSFWGPSRFNMSVLDSDADIIDIGAVSTRPGAADVSEEEEWSRLKPVLQLIADSGTQKRISIDTSRSGIVQKALTLIPDIIVNDISAGEDDPGMLEMVGSKRLTYVAMHKRGNPRTMDSCTDYPDGVVAELIRYFETFSRKAELAQINDWILDPGLGFAKTPQQCWEILENLESLKIFGRPILIGASDKRFNANIPERFADIKTENGLSVAEVLALRHGATILRRH